MKQMMSSELVVSVYAYAALCEIDILRCAYISSCVYASSADAFPVLPLIASRTDACSHSHGYAPRSCSPPFAPPGRRGHLHVAPHRRRRLPLAPQRRRHLPELFQAPPCSPPPCILSNLARDDANGRRSKVAFSRAGDELLGEEALDLRARVAARQGGAGSACSGDDLAGFADHRERWRWTSLVGAARSRVELLRPRRRSRQTVVVVQQRRHAQPATAGAGTRGSLRGRRHLTEMVLFSEIFCQMPADAGHSSTGKRKQRYATGSPSEVMRAVEYESAHSAAVTKREPSSTGKRRREAQVHNLSERRRRDRINEKMRALQELIPHCNKGFDLGQVWHWLEMCFLSALTHVL
ncbi:uncharacterized protein LOC124647845 [Lolium rigidum]|uniref:uncharacterized protein LOC124647845 n=1 Tax=Lolium rigidum TaxID=89674 RepID=UPI001F5D3FC0|nr:uncharacterized protein LOC124647845 [Lolium rigidum]